MKKTLLRSALQLLCITGSFAFIICEAAAFPAATGGATSVNKQDANAFSLPSGNMSFEKRMDFNVGNSFFRSPWVIAPSSTTARDGLGPLFNTNGCQNCHIKDGRGHLPQEGDANMVSMLVRISVPPKSQQDWQKIYDHGVIADPIYGDQIQDFAIPGAKPEAKVNLSYETRTVTLADGKQVELSKPVVKLSDFGYGAPSEQLSISLRMAPPMIGLGLLEAISESDLRKLEDEHDKNGDQISGRLNRVWDQSRGGYTIGRFGWKAEQPSTRQQNAGAFNGDMGITSSVFPNESCTAAQKDCSQLPSGGSPEITDKLLDLVTFYSRNLAVPLRRNIDDPRVKKGEQLFVSSGCIDCHHAPFTTADLEDHKEQSNQTIYPFTDLLLHDMGEELSDNRPVYAANGNEWRTPPLWGIGLTKEVSGAEHYLHDGRARSLLEAILWHGGEAEASQRKVTKMSSQERDALISFLESL